MADIDFANPESRMNYLKDNLGHLMKGIDKNYGQVLMDELMNRLEQTVSEFNEEVKAMLGQLQGVKTPPRDNILASKPRTAYSEPAPIPTPIPDPIPDPIPEPLSEPVAETELPELDVKPIKEVEIEVDEGGLSEFEKRLQALDQ